MVTNVADTNHRNAGAATPTMAGNYTIEFGEAALHRADLLELWRRGFGRSNAKRFDWIYDKGHGRAVCALLRNEDGRIVGMNGLRLRGVWINGREHQVGQAIDLVVEPDYRSAGPAIGLQRKISAEAARLGVAALYGCPGPATARAVGRRAGFQVLGQRKRWLRILRFEHVLAKAGIRNTVLQQLLSLPFNLALAVYDLARIQGGDWKAEILPGFDPRFDTLWERTREQFPVIGERSAQYLDWRFKQTPRETLQVLAVSDAAGDLRAYAVYGTEERTVTIRDLLFDDAVSLDRLLGGILRLARRNGLWAISFSFLGGERISTALKRRGFFRRPEDSYLVLQCLAAAPGADWSQWYFTEADRDV